MCFDQLSFVHWFAQVSPICILNYINWPLDLSRPDLHAEYPVQLSTALLLLPRGPQPVSNRWQVELGAPANGNETIFVLQSLE